MKTEESRTKIIATIGPASSDKNILREMILEGVDICRLNFSHGKHEDHLRVINTVKELRSELKINVALLADLQGPKLRVGEVENDEVFLVDGEEITFTNHKCMGTASRVYLSYKEFPQDVTTGDTILIDDGKLKIEVISTNGEDEVLARVIHGGVLSSRKGVNLPDTSISLPCLTEKDLLDLDFALNNDVDWVALSFVRTVTDVVELKEIIKKHKKHSLVVAKIEKPEALAEIDNIIDMTDAIMVARGDLGVEVPYEQIPLIQKMIVQKCIKASKPVIIATQMLESMITNFRPTRAEANDVGTAVLDGADTLMVSGETSTGKFPVDVIRTMHKIIQYTEENGYVFFRDHMPKGFDRTFLTDSICYTTSKMAEQSKASAIIVFTSSGETAFKISGYRPKSNIFVFTGNREILPRLMMLWGVRAFHTDTFLQIEGAIEYTTKFLLEEKLIKREDIIIHVGSTPLQKKGRANMLKLSFVS